MESSCETTKDGVTTSTVTFVEKPSRSPVSVTYATTRNVWKSEGIQYIQHVAQLSGFTGLIFGGLASCKYFLVYFKDELSPRLALLIIIFLFILSTDFHELCTNLKWESW